MEGCTLCPRMCGVDRSTGTGYCGSGALVKAARAAKHMWEEPCISGTKGSGTVFFSGCTLGCVFCQNRIISRGGVGREIGVDRLAEIFADDTTQFIGHEGVAIEAVVETFLQGFHHAGRGFDIHVRDAERLRPLQVPLDVAGSTAYFICCVTNHNRRSVGENHLEGFTMMRRPFS